MCRCVDLYNFIHESIGLNMEYCDDSPVKKRKRKGYNSRSNPQKCVIHIDSEADDKTLSGFTEKSWKVSVTSQSIMIPSALM